ncbi:MAG: OmpH family outer membrane protein [Candidatus Brocadia sp.]|nr:OmpH family outer membrane protein [Candidatus Brocadia sp.]NUO07431.1 OmpH family outer membrane protein [Candidatus Brocadia sp.]
MKSEKPVKKTSRKINIVFVVASFASLCLLSLNSIQAKESGAASAPSKGLKVGVVDLNNVFEKYEKRKAFDVQLKEQEKQYQKIVNDKKKELVSLSEKIQLLDLGSEARKKDEETFEKKNMELESYAKFAEKSLMKKYKDYFQNLYTEVCKEVEDIGRREQYDLIIKKDEPELQTGGISELQFKVGIKTVLYNSDSVNITAQVIDNLNKKYSATTKGK